MVYETVVKEVNPQAKELLSEKMFVVFGTEAPPELKPFCFIIEKNNVDQTIEKGDTLLIDDKEFDITAVGDVVNKNLQDLAHITFNFKGEKTAEMPGTLYLEEKEIPQIDEGTTLKIYKGQ